MNLIHFRPLTKQEKDWLVKGLKRSRSNFHAGMLPFISVQEAAWALMSGFLWEDVGEHALWRELDTIAKQQNPNYYVITTFNGQLSLEFLGYRSDE